MSLFARQPIVIVLIFSPIIIVANLGPASAQAMHGPGYMNNFVESHSHERIKPEKRESKVTLSPKTDVRARRMISHLSPEARRFLFSPTIQNTITNLNHNLNTMEMRGGGSERSEKRRDPEQILGYMDPESGAVEYDLKGKVEKVCFIIG